MFIIFKKIIFVGIIWFGFSLSHTAFAMKTPTEAANQIKRFFLKYKTKDVLDNHIEVRKDAIPDSDMDLISDTDSHQDESQSQVTVERKKKILKRTFSEKNITQTKEEFTKKIISQYSLGDGSDHGDQLITLRVLPDHWDYYFELQNEIAKRIPEEENRPTIDLFITGSADFPSTSIGIAGGTGPLSDSELLKLVMAKLKRSKENVDWSHFGINLFSSPPPRSLYEETKRLLSYLERMREFASRSHREFFLASNTAHLQLSEFQELININHLVFSDDATQPHLVDLVGYVSDIISKSVRTTRASILILGTLKAYDKRLYPQYLEKRGILENLEYISDEGGLSPIPPRSFYTVSNRERAVELQAYIDLAKSGHGVEAGTKIAEFILLESERLPRNVGQVKVILGCTELPMSLPRVLRDPLKKELERRLQSQVEFIDTEEYFAHRISESVKFFSKRQ